MPRLVPWFVPFALGAVVLAGAARVAHARQDERPAQDRVLGRVVDRLGAPVDGAHVTLHTQRLPLRSDFGPGETVRLDARNGRFVAQLPAGRIWSAWATWTDAQGLQHRSAIATGLVEGSIVRLQEEGRAHGPRRVHVRGLDAWQDRGPLTCRIVIPTMQRYWHVLELDAEGRAALPPLPGHAQWLELRDRDGHPLHHAELERPLGVEAHEHVVTLPAPTWIPVQVVDFETKQPIANARVEWAAFAWPIYVAPDQFRVTPLHQRDSGMGRSVLTDAQGRARVQVSWPRESAPEHFYRDVIASAPGRARSYLRRDSTPESVPPGQEPAKEQVWRFELQQSRTVRARVTGRDGAPIVGLAAAMNANAYTGTETNSYMNYGWQRLDSDAEGRFEFTKDLPTTSTLLVLVPDRGQLAQLLPAEAEPLLDLPHGSMLSVVASDQGTKDEELGELGFGHWISYEFEFERPDGRPAQGATLRWLLGSDTFAPESRCVLDRRGRGLVVLPPGTHELVCLDAKGGFLHFTLAAEKGQARAVQRHQHRLLPLRRAAFVVQDMNGAPLAGAFARPVQVAGKVPHVARRLLESSFHALQREVGTSDAEGRGEIWLPGPGSEVSIRSLQAVWVDAKGSLYRSRSRMLEADVEGPLSFEIPAKSPEQKHE